MCTPTTTDRKESINYDFYILYRLLVNVSFSISLGLNVESYSYIQCTS